MGFAEPMFSLGEGSVSQLSPALLLGPIELLQTRTLDPLVSALQISKPAAALSRVRKGIQPTSRSPLTFSKWDIKVRLRHSILHSCCTSKYTWKDSLVGYVFGKCGLSIRHRSLNMGQEAATQHSEKPKIRASSPELLKGQAGTCFPPPVSVSSCRKKRQMQTTNPLSSNCKSPPKCRISRR